jgi:hypothetical protein
MSSQLTTTITEQLAAEKSRELLRDAAAYRTYKAARTMRVESSPAAGRTRRTLRRVTRVLVASA